MPTYLRWIAAITAGITTQFAYFIIVGAIIVGTDNVEAGEGVGLLVTLGAFLASVIPTLAVNDWLAKRYPKTEGTAALGTIPVVEEQTPPPRRAQSPSDSR